MNAIATIKYSGASCSLNLKNMGYYIWFSNDKEP